MTKHDELSTAIETDDAAALERLLEEHPDLANSPDWTPPPLHCAVLWNKPQMAEVLLDNGADIELRDPDRNTTALRYAIVYGKKEMIRLLVSRGANAGAIVDNGTTALQMATDNAAGTLEEFEELPSRQEYREIVELLKELGLQMSE